MTNDDILRAAAALICKNERPDPNGCVVDIPQAIDKICRMAGINLNRGREISITLMKRIKPYTTMRDWMAAKGPRPTEDQARLHSANWLLKIAGPAPKATPQNYTPKRRRR